MGNCRSADVAEDDLHGHLDERFNDVKRIFASQRLAQLCVFVEGEMVVSVLNLEFDL